MDVRTLREARGLTRTELAEAASVDWATVWRLEEGLSQGSPPILRRLASALGVSIDELMGEEVGA
jgi:transcriptional regulator with XRE-family HTH domain